MTTIEKLQWLVDRGLKIEIGFFNQHKFMPEYRLIACDSGNNSMRLFWGMTIVECIDLAFKSINKP